MPSTDLPLRELTYAPGERASLMPSGRQDGKSLRRLYDERLLDAFKAKLRTPSGRGQDLLDLLHAALGDEDRDEFLDAILHEVDASLGDVADARRDLRTPLISAADVGHARALRMLLPDGEGARAGAGVRRLEARDRFGSTALHAAVASANDASDNDAKERLECVRFLLGKHRDLAVDVRAQDQRGRTALYLAAKHGSLDLVKEFLKHDNIGLDIGPPTSAKHQEASADTARSHAARRFPSLAAELRTRPHDADMLLGDQLQRLLERDDADSQKEFCAKVSASSPDARALRHPCGDLSLTQLACFLGRRDAVDALIATAPALAAASGDAPNRTPPLLLAAGRGRVGVVDVFRRRAPKQFEARSPEGDTALIALVRRWDGADERYPACLALLLGADCVALADVNATNAAGDSALHLAAICRLPHVATALLGAGAWMGGANKRGVTPLDHLSAGALEQHLDACVASVGNIGSDEREIVFDYACLRAPPLPKATTSSGKSPLPGDAERAVANDVPRREMEALHAVSRSKELRRLLKHPVLHSFLDHKWEQMHSIFYVNAVLYALFVIFITWHILEVGGKPDSEHGPAETTPGVLALAAAGFAYVALRELAQALSDMRRYLRDAENALEVALLVCAGFVLGNALWPAEGGADPRYFAAATILLAWGELVLLLGRHPRCATYVEMLKTVTWNFLKFLIWFAGLIVAFALCFFTLFRNEASSEAFRDVSLSSFKTLVMMTGELDVDGVPLDGLPFISRPVFVAFVFLIVIVLLNLLNGLAVSDTQAIKDNAELVCCVSRVAMAERVEAKLFEWLRLARRLGPCAERVASRLVRSVSVFREPGASPEGRLQPNGDRTLRVQAQLQTSATGGSCCCLVGRLGFGDCCRANAKVVKRAEAVLAARGVRSELREAEDRLSRRLDEVVSDLDQRIARHFADIGRDVAAAVRAAIDERTTQL